MRFQALPTACLALLFGSLSQAQSVSSVSTAAEQTRITCPSGKGVGVIAARGSTEDPGEGRLLAPIIANATVQVPGTTLTSVDYPARLFPDYLGSEQEGVVALTALMRSYVAACPGAPMVLVGYSQGAQVIADVVSNATTPMDNSAQPLSMNDVAGILLIGDPSRVDGKPFNSGTADGDGLFSREDSTALEAMGDKILSICNDGDPVCDRGINIAVHLSYDETNGVEATQFIVSKALNLAAPKEPKAPASNSTTPGANRRRATAWVA
ncbi:cutinase-domain-containing protein [Apiospora rasikravindrae]|uniref:Cutinase-domain-containing protein n=1 Tax=Apiospora rasikravindrae TaxID=990691 RepID=A0ABR1U8T2_9PEZI